MKILLIDVNCKNSSTGKIVYDLYSMLNSRGHLTAVCYGRGAKIYEPNIYKFSSDIETYIHALLTRITGLTGYFSPFATRRLIKYIDKFKPDIVHIHELHAYFVNFIPVINYLKSKKIKTIWTFHCEFMYTGKCGYTYECNNWKEKCGKCPQKREYPRSLFFDFTSKMLKDKKRAFKGFNNLTIVTPSEWLANRVKQSFLKNINVIVINNGIDIEEVFYPNKYIDILEKHNLKNEKIILAVAPDIMSERKGGRFVIKLAKKMANEKIKFILIGVKDTTESFENNVIALGVTKNQAELAKYYSLADAFVICSKMENFPTTCLESLACGTPVVGFAVGGVVEIGNEYCSNYVEYGEINGLQSMIMKLLKIEKKQRVLLCEKYAAKHYSRNIMLEKYFVLYDIKKLGKER